MGTRAEHLHLLRDPGLCFDHLATDPFFVPCSICGELGWSQEDPRLAEEWEQVGGKLAVPEVYECYACADTNCAAAAHLECIEVQPKPPRTNGSTRYGSGWFADGPGIFCSRCA